jgi:YD repeat-containing protein
MTIYIWGYKGRYPVAKIECCIQLTSSLLLASSYYNTVISCIGSTNLSILDINPTDDQIRTIFSSLQANPNLKGAMITYYTYKPLVGITSETDPHGVTTYYDYDPFNRLMDIKDINSKKIKEFQYHYKP